MKAQEIRERISELENQEELTAEEQVELAQLNELYRQTFLEADNPIMEGR
jgi:hypothetical protein